MSSWADHREKPFLSARAKLLNMPLGSLAGPLFLIAATSMWITPAATSLIQRYWNTDQGSHGPLVVAIGVGMGVHLYRQVRHLARPGSPMIAIPMLFLAILLATASRLIGLLPGQVLACLFGIIAVIYGLVGPRVLRRLWMPVALLFAAIPVPYFIEQALTAQLKLQIAKW